MEVEVEKGDYFLLFGGGEVSAYGSAKVYFVRDEKEKYPLSDVMHSLMISYAEQRKDQFKTIAPDITCFTHTDIWQFGYACE